MMVTKREAPREADSEQKRQVWALVVNRELKHGKSKSAAIALANRAVERIKGMEIR